MKMLTEIQNYIKTRSEHFDLTDPREAVLTLFSIKSLYPGDYDLIIAEIANYFDIAEIVDLAITSSSVYYISEQRDYAAKKWVERELAYIESMQTGNKVEEPCDIEAFKRDRELNS